MAPWIRRFCDSLFLFMMVELLVHLPHADPQMFSLENIVSLVGVALSLTAITLVIAGVVYGRFLALISGAVLAWAAAILLTTDGVLTADTMPLCILVAVTLYAVRRFVKSWFFASSVRQPLIPLDHYL